MNIIQDIQLSYINSQWKECLWDISWMKPLDLRAMYLNLPEQDKEEVMQLLSSIIPFSWSMEAFNWETLITQEELSWWEKALNVIFDFVWKPLEAIVWTWWAVFAIIKASPIWRASKYDSEALWRAVWRKPWEIVNLVARSHDIWYIEKYVELNSIDLLKKKLTSSDLTNHSNVARMMRDYVNQIWENIPEWLLKRIDDYYSDLLHHARMQKRWLIETDLIEMREIINNINN